MRLALLALTLVPLFAADSKSADAVKAAEKSWAAATVAGDAATLGKLLANDLTYTHSTGDTDSKSTFIGNLKGERKYTKLDHDSMEVRVYGSSAVLVGTAQVATSMSGKPPAPAHLRFLHVWIYEGGRWQMVAHQSLRLAN